MTKTKQWILSVIFAAVLVSALFFGIMLSDPVYITARAEVSPRAAQTISLEDITISNNYVSQGMTWDLGNDGSDSDNVWRLNKQFKQYFANDNSAPAFTKDDAFYRYATISQIEQVGNPSTFINSETEDKTVQTGFHYVTVTLADNDQYQLAEGTRAATFSLNLDPQSEIQLNNVSLRMPLTYGARWSFEDVLSALKADKLNGSTDNNNNFLSMESFYTGLQIANISTATGDVYNGATAMEVGVYEVKLALPQDGAYIWNSAEGSDTFTLTVYENVSLQNLSIAIDYNENLYWQANTETAGRNYITPASAEFKQGIVNPPQDIAHLLADDSFLGNLKITAIQNYSNGNAVALGSAVKAGSYMLTLDFVNQNGLYQWTDANANQVSFEIIKKVLSLGSYENMHWALEDGSDLDSDTVYQYTYTTAGGAAQNYYSLTQLAFAPNSSWSNWTFVGSTQSNNSVVRYTGSTSQLKVVFGGLTASDGNFSYNNYNNSQVGKYTASVTVTLNDDCNYMFDEHDMSPSEIYDLQSRGVTIEFSGQSVRITKVWYIAAMYNSLLAGELGNDGAFTVANWTFGIEPSISAPRLANGESDKYTATLVNLDSGVNYPGFNASSWTTYFNRFMPAGRYQLIIAVAQQDSFLAYSTSYYFTVEKAQLTVDESAVNAYNQSGDFNTKVVTGSGAIDYSKLFVSVQKLVFGEYITAEDRQANGGYWASQNSLFDNAPVCVFKTAGMLGDSYFKATDSVWSSQFTKVDKYTVLYKVTMKNYVTVGENNPYEHFFYVSLCRIITEKPVLATLSYNGQNQTPYLINNDADRIYYDVVAGQSFMTVGTHDVKIAIKDEYKAYVMWSENDVTGITTVKLTINPTENYWRVSPRIADWRYGDAIPTPEAEAFYFNVANGDTKTFK